MATNPGAVVVTITIGGKTFNAGTRTAAHLKLTFAEFSRRFPKAQMFIEQGCYHTGVTASSHTHDKDGVIDFGVSGLDWWSFQQFLRQMGWAAWWRHTGQWAPPSEWHCHAISLGCPGPVGSLVPGQITDYYNHAFGLMNGHTPGSDRSWHPADIDATIFVWPPKPLADRLLVSQARAKFAEGQALLVRAASVTTFVTYRVSVNELHAQIAAAIASKPGI